MAVGIAISRRPPGRKIDSRGRALPGTNFDGFYTHRCKSCGVIISRDRRALSKEQYCPTCIAASWTVVYDRAAGVGAIPDNLRKAYGEALK